MIQETDPITGGTEMVSVGDNQPITSHIMLALQNSVPSINLAVDGSVTPVYFYVQPAGGKQYKLKRMNIKIVAASFANALRYGGLGTGSGLAAGLPNGLRVFTEYGGTPGSGTLIREYTVDRKIKTTDDWALLAGVDARTESGTFDDPYLIRWTFAKSCGHIILNGYNNERLVVAVRDDLSGLSSHINMVSGIETVI